MKVKVKGLVFVGFAAMIFAANAMAANEDKTVTSRAYTEATYQKKSTAASIGNSSGTWTNLATEITNDSSTAPTTAAVYEYVGDSIVDALNSGIAGGDYISASYDTTTGVTTVAIDSGDVTSTYDTTNGLDSDSDNIVTEGVIAQAIAAVESGTGANYQAKSSGVSLGYDSGTWATITEGNYADITDNGNGTVTMGVDSSQVTSSYDTTTGLSTTSTNLIQEKVVAAAITDAVTDANLSQYEEKTNKVSSISATNSADTTVYPNTKAVYDYVNAYSAAGAEVNVQADWNVTDTTSDAYINNKPTLTNDSAEIGNATASDSTQLPSTYAVKQYVADQTGGAAIPAMDTSVCTSAHPCALVNVNGENHWYTMAQDGYNGGELGDVTNP